MNPYITTVNFTHLQGLPADIFASTLEFKNGLNLISGENGTGKTLVLSHIKRFVGHGTYKLISFQNTEPQPYRVLMFNPKRNSQKQNMQQIAENLRKQGITSKKQIAGIIGQQVNDQAVTTYPSFGELFHSQVQAKIGTGIMTGQDAVIQVVTEFNQILNQVFPNYQINASWNASGDQPSPTLSFTKYGVSGINHESLSCGEREVFSLIFNIFTSKDEVDVYLIDEPEIHLNWSLENNLFDFLEWFAETYKKQVVVVTHSRVIFLKKFINKTKFFGWNSGKIEIQDFVSEDIRKAIGGDSINIIKSLEMSDKTFFVEDGISDLIIKNLAKVTTKNISATRAGNSASVKAVCRVAKEQGITNALFMIDGDNEGVPPEFSSNSSFIKLSKYCIENYLLDFETLAKISNPGKTIDEIKTIINNIVKTNNDNKNKAFLAMASTGSLIDNMPVLDTFDASYILSDKQGKLASKLGLSNKEELVEKFIETVHRDGKLDSVFPEIMSKF